LKRSGISARGLGRGTEAGSQHKEINEKEDAAKQSRGVEVLERFNEDGWGRLERVH